MLVLSYSCKFCALIQDGKLPDNSLYDKSLKAKDKILSLHDNRNEIEKKEILNRASIHMFRSDELFCDGSPPVNLLLPRNLEIGKG